MYIRSLLSVPKPGIASFIFWFRSFVVGLPDNIIDAYNILLFGVLRRADDSGTGLHPSVSAQLVHYSVVVGQDLPFVHYCKGRNSRLFGIEDKKVL